MSPSSARPSARDPFDDGAAPWTDRTPTAGRSPEDDTTRPLPRPTAAGRSGIPGGGTAGEDVASSRPRRTQQHAPGAHTAPTAAVPAVADDAARATSSSTSATAPRTGRTGVASGRLHPRDADSAAAGPVGDDHLTRPQERISAEAAWDTMRPAVRPDGVTALRRPSAEELRGRQKRRFGGLQVLPGLMGLLVAVGLAAVLLAVAALTAPGFGVDTTAGAGDALSRAWREPGTGLLWAAVAVAGGVEFLSMLAGGYTAGRMGRFSGVAQGMGVWLWALLARAVVSVAVLLGAGTAGLGAGWWTVQELLGSDPGVGLVAVAGLLVLGLVAALLGGIWGMRYHRKVDAWTVSNALSE